MLDFKSFLTEANIASQGINALRHVEKYIKPFLPGGTKHSAEGTHTLISPTQHIAAGEKVVVHSHSVENGVHHVTVSKPGSKTTEKIKVSKLKKPHEVNPFGREDEQINSIKHQIETHVKNNGGKPLKMNVGGRTMSVAGVTRIGGKVKADYALHDEHGKPVHFVSLKSQPKSSSFSGYGGFSHMLEHPTISRAINKLTSSIGKKPLEKGEMAFHPFKAGDKHDENAFSKLIFGKEHGSKEHGPSNIHHIQHGDVHITKQPDGSFSMKSGLDVFNDGKPKIRELSKAHGAPMGIGVRKGEQGARFIPGTKVEGRGMTISSAARSKAKVRIEQ